MSQSDMNQTNELMSKTIEMQQNAMTIGQQALDEAVEIPLKQTIELQKSAGQLFLNGIEMSSWLGNRSAQLTRDALDTYFSTVDTAAQNAVQMTEEGIEEISDMGQETLRSQQQQLMSAPQGQQPQPQQQPPQSQTAMQTAPTPQPPAQQMQQGQQPPAQQIQQPATQQPPTQQIQQPATQPPAQQVQQPASQQSTQESSQRRQVPVTTGPGVSEEESGNTEAPVESS